MAEEYGDEVEERTINEEYKIWKKNVPFLYDVVVTHALEWPSLTSQWLPVRNSVAGGDYAEHQLLIGTHTSGAEPNHLCIATVRLPTEDTELDATKYDEERGELGGYGGSQAKVEITVRINHDREVNRARYCPQNHFVVATKSPSADVLVFDWSKHPSRPADSSVRPLVRCKGHEKEGYGLAWSPHTAGRLASAGDDKLVCVFDVETGPAEAAASGGAAAGSGAERSPSVRVTGHADVVEDVSWHRFTPDLLGSCGDDQLVAAWDLRDASGGGAKPMISFTGGHAGDVMSLSFSPFQEYLLLTASVDKTVKLWDMRKPTAPIHSFEGHTDEVVNVDWSPFNESVFASSSADRRLFVWDCSRIGQEQTEEDAEDGAPELLFVHGGHTSKISDFSWNETEDWFIASVAEDNVLQVWQMASSIYADDEEGEAAALAAAAAGAAPGGASAGGAAAKKGGKAAPPADRDLE